MNKEDLLNLLMKAQSKMLEDAKKELTGTNILMLTVTTSAFISEVLAMLEE